MTDLRKSKPASWLPCLMGLVRIHHTIEAGANAEFDGVGQFAIGLEIIGGNIIRSAASNAAAHRHIQ